MVKGYFHTPESRNDIHTGEKKFQFDINLLKTGMYLIFIKGRIYQCELCRCKYAGNIALKRHMGEDRRRKCHVEYKISQNIA